MSVVRGTITVTATAPDASGEMMHPKGEIGVVTRVRIVVVHHFVPFVSIVGRWWRMTPVWLVGVTIGRRVSGGFLLAPSTRLRLIDALPRVISVFGGGNISVGIRIVAWKRRRR